MNDFISNNLLNWYNINQRDLPWRKTQDPYRIWLSEIILQQTRVGQGLPYYEKFIENFPNVGELAGATEQEVLRLWQGLGYYSRARNLHFCAKTVVKDYGGHFPENYQELIKLKGIGPYTAAAIASFAFKEVIPVVDGNVYRVLSRLFGITTNIAQPSAYKEFFLVASQLIPPLQPDRFNQAIMEFGAMHCTPAKPLCLYCPVKEACYAFQHSKQKDLPVKKSGIKMKHRYFHYFIFITEEGKILMHRRENKDIWQGLFDFYLIESGNFETPETINNLFLQQLLSKNCILAEESIAYQHQLTHQRLHVKFFHVKCSLQTERELKKEVPELKEYSKEETEALPKPILIKKYLEKHIF